MSQSNGTRRVVVTGMGALSGLGNDVESTWAGLLAGKSGVRTITLFDPSRVDSKIASEVRDFDPSGVIDRKEMRRMDRYIQFGLVVARQALDQAGLPGRMDGALAERTGVIMGSGLGRDNVTAVFVAFTISATIESFDPVHWNSAPNNLHASSAPYCVGVKNGFVVT